MAMPYRGTLIAIICSLSAGLMMSMLVYCFGLFANELRMEFGWSALEINFALSFGIINIFTAPLYGRISDKYGIKIVMIICYLVVGFGYLFRPMIDTLFEWYLFSAIVAAGLPIHTLAGGKLIPLWYPDSKGKVMGIVYTGDNIGGMIMPAITVFFIIFLSWQLAFFLFGIINFIFAFLAFLFITDSFEIIKKERSKHNLSQSLNSKIDQTTIGVDLREGFFSLRMWLVMISIGLGLITLTGIVTQLPQFLEERNINIAIINLSVFSLSLGGLLSKIFIGRLSDKISALNSMIISFILQAAGIYLLIISFSNYGLILCAFFFGFGMGAMGPLVNLLISEQFGMKNFGSFLSLAYILFTITSSFIPIYNGYIKDAYGTYDIGFYSIIFALILGMTILYLSKYLKKYDFEK